MEKSLDLLLVSTWLSSFWICGRQVVNAMTCADDLVVGNIVVCNNVYSSVAGSLDDDDETLQWDKCLACEQVWYSEASSGLCVYAYCTNACLRVAFDMLDFLWRVVLVGKACGFKN